MPPEFKLFIPSTPASRGGNATTARTHENDAAGAVLETTGYTDVPQQPSGDENVMNVEIVEITGEEGNEAAEDVGVVVPPADTPQQQAVTVSSS